LRLVTLYVFSILLVGNVLAVSVIPEISHPVCEDVQLYKPLTLYKDPQLFLSNLSVMLHVDPSVTVEELYDEGAVITQFEGRVKLMRLGHPRGFNQFIHRIVKPRRKSLKVTAQKESAVTMIIPVKICGERMDAYSDTVGFVVEEELKAARVDDIDLGNLPPSGYPNPIPKIKKSEILKEKG